MKNGILAGLGGVLATGVIILYSATGGDPSICPEVCPGEQCLPLPNYCLALDKGQSKRVKPDGTVVANVSELAPDKQERPLICCVTNEETGIEHEAVRWSAVTVPPVNCLQLLPPDRFGGISMNQVDLDGRAEKWNQLCCKRKDGPVIPGSTGQCPQCAFKCVAGRPEPDPGGCDEFCAIPEEVP